MEGGGQLMTWQKQMKNLTHGVANAYPVRLPGCGVIPEVVVGGNRKGLNVAVSGLLVFEVFPLLYIRSTYYFPVCHCSKPFSF